MSQNKSIFILSFLILLTGLLVFFSQSSLAQTIIISDWCQKTYCGGCTQNECISKAILPDISMPINEVCEWRDNFCYTQMMNTEKISKVTDWSWEKARPAKAMYKSDKTQFFWNNNYGAISYALPVLKKITNIYEIAPAYYFCTGPFKKVAFTCPQDYPLEPELEAKKDSSPNLPEWANIFKPLISLFKKSFHPTTSAEGIS